MSFASWTESRFPLLIANKDNKLMNCWMWAFSILVVAGVATLMAQPPGGGRGGRPPSPIVEALDADNDGVISAEELKNASATLVTLDKNKDGKLTEDEYRSQGGARPGGGAGGPGGREGGVGDSPSPGGGERGAGMAPNSERMLAHALEFDADKDGKLSKEELQKFVEDFVKRHSGPGGAGTGPSRSRQGGAGGGRPGEVERPERPRRPD